MPAPAGTKRVKGVQIFRPFVYGSIATPIDPLNRNPSFHPDHTHSWSVYVKGVNDEDISYWLKKVQFKLHETYPNSTRMIEVPPFSVSETGWGEFEVQMKLFFVTPANEKAATLWHSLKLHPYGPDAEGQRARRDDIISQHYEEVLFNEPVEAFYDILTSGAPVVQQGRGKGAKAAVKGVKGGNRTAEIPPYESKGNPYSLQQEGREIDILREAMKTVDQMAKEERGRLKQKEAEMERLKKEAAPQNNATAAEAG